MSKNFEKRPWGDFRVLSKENDHEVKRITVTPGKRLSLQSHNGRSEHWYIVKGQGIVTLNDRSIDIKPGSSIDIPLGAKHRVENTGTNEMVIIEVQTGDDIREDDIVRYEDDFGRV